MAIGGSPPNAPPREKDGTKGTAGRYGFVAEVLRGYLGGLWMARDPSDATERGTVLVRRVVPIPTASARAAILEAARWAQTAGASTLEIIEGRNGVDLVTPFADAEPLRSLLRTAALKHVPLDPSVLLGITAMILEQLASVHEAARSGKSPHGFGGLHPDSILVGTDGQVQLIDAGIAAAASAREPWKSDAQRVGYFAPEQLDLKGVADARTDVFALGIVLWEAFGNRRLFPGADAKSARERVQKGAIVRLDATRPTASAAIAAPIADLVAHALDRDPARRFQTADEMAAAVRALEPADSARIGAWVTTLAETVIAKRRQLLERVSLGGVLPSAPAAGRLSVRPAARPSVPPASARPSAPLAARPSAPPAAARPSVPPAARPSAPPAAARPSAPPASARPSVPTASARPSVPPASAHPSAPPSVPRPGGIVPAQPAPAAERANETPGPPAGDSPNIEAIGATAPTNVEAPPPGPEPEPAEPAVIAPPPAPEGSAPAEPSAAAPVDAPAVEAVSGPSAPAGDSSSEGADEAADGDADAMEVTDDDLGGPPPAPSMRPSPLTSRPPRLPEDVQPAVEPAVGDPSLLGGPGEPLASPMGTPSQLATLTSPAAPRSRRRMLLAVALALVVGVGVGGWWRHRSAKLGANGNRVERVSLEAHVESVTAVPTPSASAEAVKENSTPPPATVQPSSSAGPTSSEQAPPPAVPSAEGETRTGPAAVGNHTQTGQPLPPHRPPPSRGEANSGYKPGGI